MSALCQSRTSWFFTRPPGQSIAIMEVGRISSRKLRTPRQCQYLLPFPESVSEEHEIYADYNGCHRDHVKHHSYPSVHFSTTSFHFCAQRSGNPKGDGWDQRSQPRLSFCQECRHSREGSAPEKRRSRSPSGKWECGPRLLPGATDPLTVAKLRLGLN
jgi:hypothetical protein